MTKRATTALFLWVVWTSSFNNCSNLLAETRAKNELPMFGGSEGEWFETSAKMCRLYADLGWQALSRKDFDDAIKRFNQAWLYDRTSAEPFWGFGIVLGQRAIEGEDAEDNFVQSEAFLQKAKRLDPDNPRLLVDLATSIYNLAGFFDSRGNQARASTLLGDAQILLLKAKKLDPRYQRADEQLALVQAEISKHGKH